MTELIVFDLDGTLALTHHRNHLIQGNKKDWRGFYASCIDDEPHKPVITMFQALKAQGYRVEIWSGRSDEVRPQTEEWLAQYGIKPDHLRMRAQDDFTPDQILKESWLLENPLRPLIIFDDRDKVVAMWRQHGITCCQVAEGNF